MGYAKEQQQTILIISIKKIDWDETNNINLVSINEFNSIGKILSTECTIHLMRKSDNVCDSVIEEMVSIRRGLINQHNTLFGDYVEDLQDFY